MPEYTAPSVRQRQPSGPTSSTLDPDEVARFSRLAEDWWDPAGRMAPLHRIGPARLAYIRRQVIRHFNRPATVAKALAGLRVLDVGCGAGLVSEPLARLGGLVTAIDPAAESIAAARLHAEPQGLAIDYRAARLEEIVGAGDAFDLAVCLEVLEHVPDPAAFVGLLARAVRPGGLLIVSTINRTLKSYALAIVGAEYVLRWLPVGTHRWDRFITTEELQRAFRAAGLDPGGVEGLVLDPLRAEWRLGADIDVNYMAAAAKPGAEA